MDDRGEENGVGAGTDRDVLIGSLGGAGTARIDDDDRAATVTNGSDAAREVGRSADTAVRHERVGAEQHEQIGAVEIGNRHPHAIAVQIARRHVARHLIDRARREHRARADRLEERSCMRIPGEIVRIRVAEVDADRFVAMLGFHGGELLADYGEGLVPLDLFEDRRTVVVEATPDNRLAEPIRIFVQLLEGRTLRADEALGEHVVLISTDARDRPVLNLDLQTTRRLTEWAGAEHGAVGRSGAGHDRHACRRAQRVPNHLRCAAWNSSRSARSTPRSVACT